MDNKLKLGDRVKLKEALSYEDGTSFPAGHIGEITNIEGHDQYEVAFDWVGYRPKGSEPQALIVLDTTEFDPA